MIQNYCYLFKLVVSTDYNYPLLRDRLLPTNAYCESMRRFWEDNSI
jgi:hypothetical protein